MKKRTLMLLLLATTAQATSDRTLSLEGFSAGFGIGGGSYHVPTESHYNYLNLNSSMLVPDGYQERNNYTIGNLRHGKGNLSAFLKYEQTLLKSLDGKQVALGLTGSMDIGGRSNIGTITNSSLTFSDTTYSGVDSRYEKPGPITLTAQFATNQHWSIGPSLSFFWQEKVTLVGRVSYHHLTSQTYQAISTTDTKYRATNTLYSAPHFQGIGVALGGIYGPKKGWFAQPELEYVRYVQELAPANSLSDSSGYEVVLTQDYLYTPRAYSARIILATAFNQLKI